MSCVYKKIPSATGLLTLVAKEDALIAVLWENETVEGLKLDQLEEVPAHPVLAEAERQLQAYFAGRRRTFELKLEPAGTEFQQAVWAALCTIPFGETRSYAQIAGAIGRPKAVRAVGAAIGRNPLGIVIPCHRVIGTNGKLTGFAAGVEVKARLLELESVASGGLG